MTVQELLREAADRLGAAGVPSADSDARTLLAQVLGVSRSALVSQSSVSAAQQAAFAEMVGRRSRREPLQHLTGTVGFRYVEVAVGPGVFVPRPETEVLAGWAVEAARAVATDGRQPVVVDLCTGSGAIALAVADEVPSAQVHAVELGKEAFGWASRNLVGTPVDVRYGDMADAFDDLDGSVDVVVCNPPYIPLTEYESVAPEARNFDPPLALWSGEDGLEAIRVLERVAARLLRPGGVVGTEHSDVQAEGVAAVFAARGRWTDLRDHRDLAGRDRYLTARLAHRPGRPAAGSEPSPQPGWSAHNCDRDPDVDNDRHND